MVAKRRGCFLIGIMSLSLIAWIVMAFVDIKTWVAAICGIVIMAIFDYGCFKEYNHVFFGPNFLIGVIVTIMVGTSISMPAVTLAVCAILMLPLYTLGVEIFTTIDKNDDYNDDE